ncbi:MAG: DNA mismatch repair endonuclease MutL [Bacteroidales bacterium]|nr:DNA mismatch repair endonuclease MutL [Bacteroidales bacterium]
MGALKVLPAQVANMIAAGEVVQRPASVVKELLENAVDAGADSIEVVVTDAGRTLIQVIDNGCGMAPSDAVLCFERHATSKIADPEDLMHILTYGFRGEALASIAAVSEVTLRTRRPEDESGTQVRISALQPMQTASASTPAGSNFAVRNLFYNTPARRKFLKSDNVELRHIIEEFTRVAMPHPEISFTLTHNGKNLHTLKKAPSLKFRILDLLGESVVGDIVDLQASTSMARISGFTGRPQSARKAQGNQYFFVDGRYFRSPYLHKAVMKAYEEFMPEGLSPAYFIFLDIDPQAIDVNIHPTKTEIKFEDDSLLFQLLYACIKETLGRNSFGAAIDFDTEGAVEMPTIGRGFSEYKGPDFQPEEGFDIHYNPFDSAPQAHSGTSTEQHPDKRAYIDKNENYGALFEQKSLPLMKALVIKGKYLALPSASGLMFIHIRRARERILYEATLKALENGPHVSQTALFPIDVQVGVGARLLLDEHAALLERLGFCMTPAGNDTVTVTGIPEGYGMAPGNVQQMVEDLLRILGDQTTSLDTVMRQQLAEKMAVLGASNAAEPDSPVEARALADALFSSENAEFTPSGRRIVTIMETEAIDKMFREAV